MLSLLLLLLSGGNRDDTAQERKHGVYNFMTSSCNFSLNVERLTCTLTSTNCYHFIVCELLLPVQYSLIEVGFRNGYITCVAQTR